jgi:hypothetical protein
MTTAVWKVMIRSRWLALAVTVAIFVVLFRRIPLERLMAALSQADYGLFFAAMIPNTIFYFCWDTLVLATVMRWFHGPVAYRELLPARAASYVVAFFNTNAGRGALAAYLSRRLGVPFLQLGSTVIFLVFTEYLHLVAWATIGILQIRGDVPRGLLLAPPAFAVLWLVVFLYTRGGAAPPSLRWLFAPREWALLRTFRLAPARRYAQVVLLRAPMFFVSLCLHAVAARAFGLEIPFLHLLAFLPVIFMIAALPITVARLGTTQVAWVYFFSTYADAPRLLAFSLAAHLTFVVTRSLLGILFLPRAYSELVRPLRPSLPTSEPSPAGSYK